MRYECTVDIDAPPDRIWAVVTDVERWPEWTPTVLTLRRLDTGEFGVGSRARIKQPALPSAVWEVTALDPGRSFEWQARSPGVRTVAGHHVEATGSGARVRLTVAQDGWLAGLAGVLLGRLTRRYVRAEAAGLKRRCEENGGRQPSE